MPSCSPPLFGFCLLATLLFSLGPALKSARTDIVSELKNQGAESTATGRLTRFFAPRHLLVMAQMTLALVLIFSAGLFFRGALKAGGLQLGFDPAGVVLTEMDFALANTPQPEGIRRMQAVTDRVRSLPGVQAVGWSTLIPYGNITNSARIMPADAPPRSRPDPNGSAAGRLRRLREHHSRISSRASACRFCAAVRLRSSNRRRGTRRACASWMKGMARRLFPDRDALGQRMRLTQAPADGSPAEMEVVGIVSRHRHDVMDDNGPARRIYFPLAQSYSAGVWLQRPVHEQGHRRGGGRVPLLRKELRQLDADLPVLQQLPFALLLDKSITLWSVRLGAVMFGDFRRHRAAARGGRRLRREGVCRGAAHARDRHPRGARRRPARRVLADCGRASFRLPFRWRVGLALRYWSRAGYCPRFFRGQPGRSDLARGGGGAAVGGRAAGVLPAGPPRNARQPAEGPPDRVALSAAEEAGYGANWLHDTFGFQSAYVPLGLFLPIHTWSS